MSLLSLKVHQMFEIRRNHFTFLLFGPDHDYSSISNLHSYISLHYHIRGDLIFGNRLVQTTAGFLFMIIFHAFEKVYRAIFSLYIFMQRR